MAARVGKIARLPVRIREELNQRLLDGQAGSTILPWLNGLDQVRKILGEDFEGLAVNDNNLSDWRKGGFAEWLRRQEHLDQVKSLSRFAVEMAKAGGGSLADGASSILSGQILEVLEGLRGITAPVDNESAEDAAKKVASVNEAIEGLTLSVARLRKGDQNALQLKINQQRLAQGAEQLKLEREKFELIICGKLLDAARLNKAREIADMPISNEEKIKVLRQTFFSDVDALEQSGDVKLPD